MMSYKALNPLFSLWIVILLQETEQDHIPLGQLLTGEGRAQ